MTKNVLQPWITETFVILFVIKIDPTSANMWKYTQVKNTNPYCFKYRKNSNIHTWKKYVLTAALTTNKIEKHWWIIMEN